MSDGRRAAVRLAALLGAIAIGAALLWYLSAPPKGEDGYRERAASSAETLRSQVELARIWIATVEQGDSTHAAAAVGLEETEMDAVSAADQFEGYEPPASLLELRNEYSSLAGDATEALAAIRVATEQEEWDSLPRLAASLPSISDRLAAFEEGVEP